MNIVEDAINRLPIHTDNHRIVHSLNRLKTEMNLIDGWRATFPTRVVFCAGHRGVPLFFGCSQPRACAPVTCFGLVFVFGHLRLVLDFRILDSGRWTGSACSGLRSHGYPIIARTRSTGLRRSSAVPPYVLTIVSSCSADSGLTQPLAATHASCLTHAVCSPMYLSAPGLAPCSSV
jgi:hypothetical protein